MPQSKAFRWPRRIGWALLTLILVYCTTWFALAFWIDSRMSQTKLPAVIACEDQKISGFPASFRIDCKPYTLDDRLEVMGLRLAFPITDLGRAALSLQSPSQMQTSRRGPLLAQWERLDLAGELTLTGRELEEITLNAQALKLIAGPHTLDVKTLTASLTPRDTTDLALRVDGEVIQAILPYGSQIAPLDMRIEAVLENGITRLAAARYRWRDVLRSGAVFDLKEVRFETPNGGQLALAGPLTLSPNGTLNGQVRIGMEGGPALVAWASRLGPQAQQGMQTLVQAVATIGQPAEFGPATMRAIPVQIQDGVVRLGFITLGKIPPLRF